MSDIIRYSDIDMRMNINPNTGDFSIKKNAESIKQHIRLLFVDDGILFRPETRSGINLSLFDSWNSHTNYIIKTRITEHLRIYEPRIEISNLEVEFDQSSKRLGIKLIYRIMEERQELNFKILISSIR